MTRTSFPRHKIRITLLENIHPAAREALVESGYTVDVIGKALEGDELAAVLAESHVVGLRSRTKLRSAQLELGTKLMAIGCFSVVVHAFFIPSARRPASAGRFSGFPSLNLPAVTLPLAPLK